MRIAGSIVLLVGCALLAAPALADTITCPADDLDPDRQLTFTNVEACATVSGNPRPADVAAAYGGAPDHWTNEGERTAVGTDDLLTIAVTSGPGFGGANTGGTWAIHGSFWDTHGEAVISLHVGNGGGDPDGWLFRITPGATTGTWLYEKNGGGGGGLSNFFLWGSGAPTPPSVPEPGTLTLMGLGLALGAASRRRRARRAA